MPRCEKCLIDTSKQYQLLHENAILTLGGIKKRLISIGEERDNPTERDLALLRSVIMQAESIHHSIQSYYDEIEEEKQFNAEGKK